MAEAAKPVVAATATGDASLNTADVPLSIEVGEAIDNDVDTDALNVDVGIRRL